MMSILAALTAILITLLATYINIVFYCISFIVMYAHLWWRKRYGNNRFNVCDPFAKHPKQTGLLPADSDYHTEFPNECRNEDILLTGVNSCGEVLILQLYWRPSQLVMKCVLGVKLYYRCATGDTYTCDDIHLTSFSPNEYKANGILLQVLSPFRRLRFRFFGYLRNNSTDKLVLTRLKFLWLTTSDVYDYQNDFSLCFTVKQLCKNGLIKILKSFPPEFDDRFEQCGQLKGEVQFGSNRVNKLFLWGIRSKKFVKRVGFKTGRETHLNNKSITQLIAYTKKGLTLHIGRVDNGFIRYHYGTTLLSSTIHSITAINTSLDQLPVIFAYEANSHQFEVQIVDDINSDTVFAKVLIENDEGYCVFVRDVDFNVKYMESVSNIESQFTDESSGETTESLVLSLDNQLATQVSLSGCKGSSLATLTKLSNDEIKFIVPKGFVVTTNAYQLFLKQNSKLYSDIQNLLKYINYPKKLSAKCRKIAKHMLSKTLPEEIQQAIQEKFINSSVALLSPFVVRLSSSFEYSKPSSSVANSHSYLGVNGLNDIYCAIIKCWSAQFDPKIIYHRNDVATDMAVIIQEMVDADASGIVFTCDPHSCDQGSVMINANYGMMQSVVSSLSEPDHIQVVIDIKSNSLWTNERKVSHIGDVKIGSKKKVVKLNPTNNSTEVQVYYGVKKCCINKELATKLANIALSIQTYHNYNCDIEWCVKDGKCYILQCRPIACADSFDEFELSHELDTGMPNERGCVSTAHVAEVLPGVVSHLTASYLFFNLFNVHRYRNVIKTEGQPKKYYSPYKQTLVVNQCNHLFANLDENDFIDCAKKSDNIFAKVMMLSFFGTEINCDELVPHLMPKITRTNRPRFLWKFVSIIPQLILPEYCARKYEYRTNQYCSALNSPKNKFQTSHQLIEHICQSFEQMSDAMVYLNCLLALELVNCFLIGLLNAGKKQYSESEILSDYLKILSNCGDIMSDNVCSEIRNIALSIEDQSKFKQLSDENATLFLLTSNTKTSQLFKAFVAKYGHRGFKELDVMSRVWRMDYNPIINALKAMLTDDTLNEEKTSQLTDIRTQLAIPHKWLLNYVAIPVCRRALRTKERVKSILAKMIDSHRKAFHMLADMMTSEGRIPDPKLIWHMTLEEIYLLTITHNHNTVNKARQRERLFTRIDKWRFREFFVGFNFFPRNLDIYENKLEMHMNNNHQECGKYTTLKGTAVTSGKIIGTVCVAQYFEDAANIKSGDILVTYSTDICWSPYFCLLGGIITEMGGIHSHVSVTARQLNLPAMIAVSNACQIMKTGDQVLLDCDKAIITLVANFDCDNGLINRIVNLDDDID